MLAVCLGNADGQFASRHVPVPRPGKGEVLVKMAAAPVNPSDLARIKYLIDPAERASFIPGVEGSGRVIACGAGLVPHMWLGRRVACSSAHSTSGTWAEYMVTSAMMCVPLPQGISDEQGAMLLVNPMTALAFFDMVKRDGHKAIISTAAASSLGRIIKMLGEKHHISVIHVVRNEKQQDILKRQGAEYVLNSSVSGFSDSLHTLSHKLEASLVLDAVGGNLTRQLLLAVPFGSTVVVYGNLSGEQPEIDHRSLVMDNKKVMGFYLGNWLKETGILTTVHNIFRARKLLRKGISIPVQGRFPLDKAQQAVETYLAHMTAGKVLVIPG